MTEIVNVQLWHLYEKYMSMEGNEAVGAVTKVTGKYIGYSPYTRTTSR
jgi:hypothetical protein